MYLFTTDFRVNQNPSDVRTRVVNSPTFMRTGPQPDRTGLCRLDQTVERDAWQEKLAQTKKTQNRGESLSRAAVQKFFPL